MPTYIYFCNDCGEQEVTQKISDHPLDQCPSCEGTDFKKKFSAVGVAFKGKGFYSTDSRGK